MSDLRDLQMQYEETSDSQAAADRFAALRSGAKEGDINLPRAQKFISRAFSAVKDSLDAAVAVQTRGVGGKYKSWLRKVPTGVAAVIALRECIRQCTSKRDGIVTIQSLASDVGKLYELEVRIREAESVNPLYMKRIHDQVQENGTTSQSHLRALYSTAYKAVMKGAIDSTLTASEIIQLGKFGVQAVVDAGVLETGRTKVPGLGPARFGIEFKLAPEVWEFLTEYDDQDVQNITDKAAGAMLCVPDQWTDIRDGGYLTPRRKFNQPLLNLGDVRKSERVRLRREVYTAENMPLVFEAGNYLQEQSFAVHRPTLDAINRLWQNGGGVMGVPTKDGPRKPAFPFHESWTKQDASEAELEVFTKWKRACLVYYTALKEWRGRAREVGGFIKVAASAASEVWFPVFMDTRGRWYYRGSPNPQGSDLSKGALHFGKKKPLGADGVYWLRVHIANCFGFDKERFDVRARWTAENWPRIQAALSAPEDSPEVFGDAPWCMFSAAWELNQALLSGNPEAYETGVVVHMDATCSGLQHFSAMLRDPVGGAYVNLMDDDLGGPKQDIYAKVAQNAMEAIKLDTLSDDPELARIARWWLQRGIPRDMAKKPVMTYVYGATLRSTTEFVQDKVETSDDPHWPENVRPYDMAAYAAKKLFQGIALTVPAAESAMQWLRSVAKQMPNGQRMEWTAPTGFRVQHDYQDYDEVRVYIRSCGIDKVVVHEYNDDTRALPMQNAIAPNFVHALDAAHLTLTAIAMKRRGLSMVGIHDSYGTHPSDVAAMHTCIRTSFVGLYEGRNVLSEFLWEVNGLGEAPMRGTLDLRAVLDSEFFFC